MSDLITTTQDTYRDRCIELSWAPSRRSPSALGTRKGQTAAEYMGVLLLVSAIIAATSSRSPARPSQARSAR